MHWFTFFYFLFLALVFWFQFSPTSSAFVSVPKSSKLNIQLMGKLLPWVFFLFLFLHFFKGQTTNTVKKKFSSKTYHFINIEACRLAGEFSLLTVLAFVLRSSFFNSEKQFSEFRLKKVFCLFSFLWHLFFWKAMESGKSYVLKFGFDKV